MVSETTWADISPGALPVKIEVTISAGTATILLSGELDVTTRPFISDHLARLMAEEPGRLVFDLAQVGFADCGALRLIAGAGRLLPGSGRPVIRHPSPAVRRLAELTGLAGYCEISG
jgi:anti-sigma B factor antagonist